jgi:phage FluMu protein gp41
LSGSGEVEQHAAMLENLTKSDVLTAIGLGLAAATLSELLPNAKPLVRSAIQFGVDLLTESEAEAEAELIQSLIEATMLCIRQDL